MLEKCTICPHNCGINRLEGQVGRCKSKDTVKIALYSTHNFEEPCISGKKGSGTVFFSNCNMNCVFCQNYEISQQGKGKEISIELCQTKGYNIKNNYNDCGVMLYDINTQKDVHAGGSGPVCSALVVFSYIFSQMKNKKLKRVLFLATGALFSPILVYQKENINSICHAISLEVV